MSEVCLQRRFPFSDCGTGRPLLGLWAVCAILDLNEDAVLFRIEDGQIEYAFDLRTAQADKRAIHVWRGSVEGRSASMQEVLDDILPPRIDPVSSVRLARQFCCSSTHVHNLVRCGLLKELNGPRRRTNARLLSRESVLRFLEERRIC